MTRRGVVPIIVPVVLSVRARVLPAIIRRHLQEDCHHADGLASDTHADGQTASSSNSAASASGELLPALARYTKTSTGVPKNCQ